jgi:hypothetical protein
MSQVGFACAWAAKWISAHGAGGNVNPLFFAEIGLNQIQTSKIHSRFNSCQKIMKPVSLFF